MDLFAHPDRLWWLAALVPLAGWVARGSRRRVRDWKALGQSGRPPGDESWGWVAAMVLVVVALAQPRWGRFPGSEAPEGHDVVLLVDVSRSMAAEDAVPNRLGVAIEAGSSLLQAMESEPGSRVSVVAFAGRGVVVCPMTWNLDAAGGALRSLRPGEVKPGGTDLGAALDAALGAFDEEQHADGRSIVVFSDGEDHVGSWSSMIEKLQDDGIVVHSVAIGDLDRGHPIPSDGRNALSDPPPLTRRSDIAFQALAQKTGGAVIPLGRASADLGTLFRDRIEPTARSRRIALRLPERQERFPEFLLAAIVVGLVGSWPGLARRRGRRLAFSTLFLVALATIGASPPVAMPASLVENGRTAYDAGRFAEALEAFDRAAALNPSAAIPRYDSAAALFQLRRFPDAIVRYEEARKLGDPGLAIKIDYALGNAYLAQGDIPRALLHYDACIGSTLPGAIHQAVRSDASANRAFAAKRRNPPPGGGGSEDERPDPRSANRPRPSTESKTSGGTKNDPSSSTGSPASGKGGESAPPGPRGEGGAGGTGEAVPREGSPASRLDAALHEVREARRKRPPDAPPTGSNGVAKDW